MVLWCFFFCAGLLPAPEIGLSLCSCTLCAMVIIWYDVYNSQALTQRKTHIHLQDALLQNNGSH
jgi:hypothetical protein